MPPKKTTQKSIAKNTTKKAKKAEKIPVKNISAKNKIANKKLATKKEVKLTPPKSKKNENKKTKVSSYRRIAGSFVILTILLLAVIFYFTFIKLTIIVTPKQEDINDSLTFNIFTEKEKAENFSGDSFPGIIETVEVSQEKEYQATGKEVIGEEVVGKVIIKNNYTKNQPLVANTRLLSPDNKLFRIKNTVNVPAGGEIEVEIYTDEPSEEMAIGPTKFTIPGLWAGLQDKIFAVSEESFVYKQKVKKYIQQSDIDLAIKDMKDFLTRKVENSFIENYKGYNKVLFKIDDNSIETEVTGKVGDEQENFNVKMNVNVVVIAFNEDLVINKAKEKLKLNLPEGYEIISFNKEESTYEIQDYNINQGIASIKFDFSGKASLNTNEDIIDKQKIVGLTEEQLRDYLNDFDRITDFEIKFSPAFIKKVPNLVDCIEIKTKN